MKLFLIIWIVGRVLDLILIHCSRTLKTIYQLCLKWTNWSVFTCISIYNFIGTNSLFQKCMNLNCLFKAHLTANCKKKNSHIFKMLITKSLSTIKRKNCLFFFLFFFRTNLSKPLELASVFIVRFSRWWA